MSRLPLVREDGEATPEQVRQILHGVRARRGFKELPNVYRALANDPPLLEGFVAFITAARDPGSLTPTQCELAYLSASLVNSCYY